MDTNYIYITVSPSEQDLDELVDKLYPAIDHVILPVIWPIIISVGLIGNAATIMVLLRVEQMKTPLNVYLVSLACSDNVFLAVAPIPFLRSYAENDIHDTFHQGEFTDLSCKMIVFLCESSFQVSSFMIFCVSAERYLAICKPFKYHVFGTRRRAFKICLNIWVIVFLYQSRLLISVSANTHTFPWPDGYRGPPNESTVCNYCDRIQIMSLTCRIVKNMYVADVGVCLLVVIGIVPLYVLIVRELRKSPFTESQNVMKRSKAERKIFKTVAVTVIIYGVCFLPLRLLNLLILHHKSLDNSELIKAANLTRTPMYINAAINPIIYIITNRKYKDAFCWYFNPCGRRPAIKTAGATRLTNTAFV